MSHSTQQISAPAKTNLSLRVEGKREDGFHEIDTVMVSLSLADRLELSWTDENRVEFSCSDSDLPTGEENLVIKAVRALEAHCGKQFGIRIHLEKKIPSGAGLGGGSSDAAAVLIAMNQMGNLGLDQDQLLGLAATIGSDVPFFILQKACRCSGRGEKVVPLSPDEQEATGGLPIVLLKPTFGISAAWAYQNYLSSHHNSEFMNVPQICPWGEMVNDLERPVFQKYLLLGEMKNWLLEQPEVHAALLSGSGSTMLAVLKPVQDGHSLVKRARARYGSRLWSFVGFTQSIGENFG